MSTPEQLVHWIPNLRRYARVLTRNPVDADDLVQDTLARAVEKLDLFWPRGEGNLRAWLFSIMHNLFVNGLREQKRWTSLDDGDLDKTAAVPDPDPALLRDISAGFEALSQEQREVLLLIAVEDMSYQEAARSLKVPIGTVMSRLSRARERLARFIAGEDIPMTREAAQVIRIVK